MASPVVADNLSSTHRYGLPSITKVDTRRMRRVDSVIIPTDPPVVGPLAHGLRTHRNESKTALRCSLQQFHLTHAGPHNQMASDSLAQVCAGLDLLDHVFAVVSVTARQAPKPASDDGTSAPVRTAGRSHVEAQAQILCASSMRSISISIRPARASHQVRRPVPVPHGEKR